MISYMVCLALPVTVVSATELFEIPRKFREGDRFAYIVTRRQQHQDEVLKGVGGKWRIEVEVESVSPDRTSLKLVRVPLELDLESSPVLSEDTVNSMKQPVTAKLTIRKDGSVEAKGAHVQVVGFESPQQWYRDVFLASVPGKPIRIGDTWEEPFLDDLSTAFRAVGSPKYRYRLESVEKLDQTECLRISANASVEQTAEVSFRTGPVSASVTLRREISHTVWLKRTDGRLMKKNGTERIEIVAGVPELPLRYTLLMTLSVEPAPASASD